MEDTLPSSFKFILLLSLLALSGCSFNQTEAYIAGATPQNACTGTLKTRVIFIGDAGAPREDGREPALLGVRERALEHPEKTLVLFLGDNIYSSGFNSDANKLEREAAIGIGDQLIAASAATNAQTIFIPGNHDWSGGLDNLCRQKKYLESTKNVHYLPRECGDPGPDSFDFLNLRVLAIDTTALKKMSDSAIEKFEFKLTQEIQHARDKELVIVGHHGIVSYGNHGKYYDWKDHLMPLRIFGVRVPMPIIGSVLVAIHSELYCTGDSCRPLNPKIIGALRNSMKHSPPLIYAAGHDHSLQVLEGGEFAQLLLVSGSGSSSVVNEVSYGKDTLFSQSASGFQVLDLFQEGKGNIKVFVSDLNSSRLAYSQCIEY